MKNLFMGIFFLFFLSSCQTNARNLTAAGLSPEKLLESNGENLSYLITLCQNYGAKAVEVDGDFYINIEAVYQTENNSAMQKINPQ